MASSSRLITYSADSTGFYILGVVPGVELWVLHHARVYCAHGSGFGGELYVTSSTSGESPSLLQFSGLSWGQAAETYKHHVLLPSDALHLYLSSGGYARIVVSGQRYKYP